MSTEASCPSRTTTRPLTMVKSALSLAHSSNAPTGSWTAAPAMLRVSVRNIAMSAQKPGVICPISWARPSTCAPPRVARRSASRGVISAGPKSQPNTVRPCSWRGASIARPTRASNMAWRASLSRWPASLLALPSTPRPTGTPALSILRRGKMPLAKRILLHGQWAMPVRVLANK